METLTIEQTELSPKVLFNAETGKLLIQGKSFMENTIAFYSTLESWLDDYMKAPYEKTVLQIYLSYYNSSTFREILSILMKLSQLQNQGNNVLIEWAYDKKDTLALKKGKELAMLMKLSFEYIEK
ncbi:MAG: hypothetical protein C0594_08535 [Marinilabiliales bacterium]|nr:MAG: hypothetical protein C0594_08535 [Marinilabiliales bacterium]